MSPSWTWKDDELLNRAYRDVLPKLPSLYARPVVDDEEETDADILLDLLDAATRQSVDMTNEALAWRHATEHWMERAKAAEARMETMLSRRWVVGLAVLAFILGVLAGGGR